MLYLVVGEKGEYDEYEVWPIAVFTQRERAVSAIEEFNSMPKTSSFYDMPCFKAIEIPLDPQELTIEIRDGQDLKEFYK